MRARPAVVLACLALAGCGGQTVASAPEPRGRDAPTVRPPLQPVNGPVATDVVAGPLTLKLSDTRDPVHLRFGRAPRSGLLFDLDTGEVLWRRDPTRILPIASLTKIMTALVVAQHTTPKDKARITREALNYQGSGVGVLPRGKRVRVETLLYGLMLPSGNDAAIALAQRVSGSVERFVEAMNSEASRMGLTCTRFSSPSGILDAGNHSCAVDLAAMARALLDQPRLARIVRSRSTIRRFPIKGGRLHLFNNNPLLRQRYPGTIGVKTGYTRSAGRCLVAAVRRGGRRLGLVLLHSHDPGSHARKLFDLAFERT